MIHTIRVCAVLALAFVLAGCQSSLMTKSAGQGAEVVSPSDATVVFLRPSSFGGAIQSSVYDVTGGKTVFGGIVSSKTQVSMHMPAGRRLLMVIAENADFVNANLAAGKTYYLLIKPRVGVWKARFSLIPIHNDPSAQYSLQSKDFAAWKAACAPVSKTPAAEAWYSQHATDIQAKRVDYMHRWNGQDAAQQAELTLHENDGV